MTTENKSVENSEAVTENLLRRILDMLTAHPENLELLKTYSGDSLTKYTIRCHRADAPRIMGKAGLRYRAYRAILAAISRRFSRQLTLDNMLDPQTGDPERFPRFAYNPRWPKEEIQSLLFDVCAIVFRFPVQIRLIEAAGSAIFQLLLDPLEAAHFTEKILPHLQNLWQGIGVTNGCYIAIDANILLPGEDAP